MISYGGTGFPYVYRSYDTPDMRERLPVWGRTAFFGPYVWRDDTGFERAYCNGHRRGQTYLPNATASTGLMPECYWMLPRMLPQMLPRAYAGGRILRARASHTRRVAFVPES